MLLSSSPIFTARLEKFRQALVELADRFSEGTGSRTVEFAYFILDTYYPFQYFDFQLDLRIPA